MQYLSNTINLPASRKRGKKVYLVGVVAYYLPTGEVLLHSRNAYTFGGLPGECNISFERYKQLREKADHSIEYAHELLDMCGWKVEETPPSL